MNDDAATGRILRTDAPTVSIPTAGLGIEDLPDESLTPGMQMGGRYRIVTRLGRGGMGVVYHAEDLKLGEPVALKFLRGASASRARVAALIAEVRLGRKIAHPNVCRIHDIVEIGARHFISMEFVEGEDLDLLLKRVGRMPLRRAAQLARDICAGVRALHESGIVHRDLKPANVLVDGRGRARVSDFGLASSAREVSESTSSLSGTPLYMAPEQFGGAGASVATDIYTLGLVLWELFAGERLLAATTLDEVIAFHTGGSRAHRLSTKVPDIPEAVDDVVARCLDPDPSRRPASVEEVLRALPGGDPLDAALEAGETPTPEMVAASSAGRVLSGRSAAMLVAVIVTGLAFGGWTFERSRRAQLLDRLESPAVQEERARELLGLFGIAVGQDVAAGYAPNSVMVNHLGRRGTPERWEPLFEPESPFQLYWFRAGPDLTAWSPGRTTFDDPPFVTAGMSGIVLDPDGRLVRLRHVPDRRGEEPVVVVTWEELFARAGLDPRVFEEIAPPVSPAIGADGVRAWRGASPFVRDEELVVVAAWLRGTPVWFDAMHVWDLDVARGAESEPTPHFVRWLFGAVLVAIGLGAYLVARRNIRRGRGDARGAWNVSIALFAAWVACWAIATELRNVQEGLAYGALIGACAWCAYVAVEPEVRRLWPRILIGWTKLVHGRPGDARVGREILVGMAFALALRSGTTLASSVMVHYGIPVPDPSTLSLRGSAWGEIREVMYNAVIATLIALSLLTALALMSKVIRRLGLGIAILTTLILVVFAPAGAGAFALLLAVPLVALVREGLLACVAVYVTMFLSSDLLGLRLDGWYTSQVVVAALAMTALTAWAAMAASVGQAWTGRARNVEG